MPDDALDGVLVVIDHAYGDVEVHLMDWARIGPGPRRRVRPVAARSAATGEELPLSVIPLAYRNNAISRTLIASGLLADPWV